MNTINVKPPLHGKILNLRKWSPDLIRTDGNPAENRDQAAISDPGSFPQQPVHNVNAPELPDILSLTLFFQIKALVAQRPGILETQIISRLLTADESDIRKTCSYAEEKGFIVRKEWRGTYSLHPNVRPDDEIQPVVKRLSTG